MRRRKKRLLKTILSVGVTAAVLYGGLKFAKDLNPEIISEGSSFLKRQVENYNSDELCKPIAYSDSELEGRLCELSKTSNDYKRIYENRDKYPQEMLAAVCNNSEMTDFVLGYPVGDNSEKKAEFTREELNTDFPLLLQWDERWGYASYGDSCIGLSGCAPVCMSMIVVSLTKDKDATPDNVAAFAEKNGYYTQGFGTSWSFMTEGASHFGISGCEISLSKSIVFTELENHHPIICSMRPGDFTTEGHFIVLVKISDGKIVVNDPNSKARSNVLWDYDTLESQIKNLWAFSL